MTNLFYKVFADVLHFNISPIFLFMVTMIFWLVITFVSYLFLSRIVRRICRKIPGEIDDVILSILTKPFIFCLLIYGLLESSKVFPLSLMFQKGIHRLAMTAFILIGTYILHKIIKDIIIRYGQAWANQTDSRIDDILVPIVNLFGNLVLFLFSLFFTLSYWGINLTSILLSAGLIGLVIGLALQDTLSNIFSGINLIMDAPFKINDLIVLSDGKVCKVEKFGLRATQLYYLEEHATIYVPNKELSNSVLTNITKPTVDIKISIEVGVAVHSNLYDVKKILESVAISHPNVLVSHFNIDKKIDLISKKVSITDDEFLKQALKKLIAEKSLFHSIDSLMIILRNLLTTIHTLEKNGIDRKEKKNLDEATIPVDSAITETYSMLENWADITDPWVLKEAEIQAQKENFMSLGLRIKEKWHHLYQNYQKMTAENEMTLDDLTYDFIDWIKNDFKQVIAPFKDPSVVFKSFGSSTINLALEFYVDDIRLEHYERKQRVVQEIAFEINDRFKEANIEMPFNQLDLWIKNGKIC